MQDQITPVPERAPERKEPLRVKEIAAALRVAPPTVYAEIRSGRLASYRVGTGRGTIRVSRETFKNYLTEQGIPASDLGVEL